MLKCGLLLLLRDTDVDTHGRDFAHLCNWLSVSLCVSEHRSVCYLLTHVEVVCFFFLSHRVQLLGNCLYALEFPSAGGNHSVQATHLSFLLFLLLSLSLSPAFWSFVRSSPVDVHAFDTVQRQ